MHTVGVRLTIDLIPEFSVVIYREGENPKNYMIDAVELAAQTSELVEEQNEEAEEAEVPEAVAEGDTSEAVVEEDTNNEDEAESA